MKAKRFTWAYPGVILLAVCSLTWAVLHARFQQNETSKDGYPSVRTEAAANDPNAPDPEGGVPTLAGSGVF